MSKKKPEECPYICEECALEEGWSWVKDFVDNVYIGRCECCDKFRRLTTLAAWLKPPQ